MTPRTPQTAAGRRYATGSLEDMIRAYGPGFTLAQVVCAIEDEARALPDPTEPDDGLPDDDDDDGNPLVSLGM